jgi:hypothetical protein
MTWSIKRTDLLVRITHARWTSPKAGQHSKILINLRIRIALARHDLPAVMCGRAPRMQGMCAVRVVPSDGYRRQRKSRALTLI